jgi:hypothetical protein
MVSPGVSSPDDPHNRSMVRILPVIMLLMALLACPSAAVARPPALVALGDSLAMPRGSYVDVALGQLRTAGPWRVKRLVKLAQASETTRTILREQLRTAVRVIRRGTWNVRVVTLDIGANDGRPGLRCLVGSGIPPCSEIPGAETARACLLTPSLPPCEIRPNLARLLRTLKRALTADPGREAIVLLGMPNPWSGSGQPLEPIVDRALFGHDGHAACVRPAALQGLNDLFACAARGPILFADTQAAFAGRGSELTNIAFGDPHLNLEGARAAGLAVVHALRH